MTDDTLKLLRHALARKNQNQPISPVAVEMCGIQDHWCALTWRDMAGIREDVKRLAAKVARLEGKETQLDQE